MASNINDFGPVERAQVSSIGLPGQRTFRLQFENPRGDTSSLWIEKEQMVALGSAIDQLMAQLSGDPYIDIVTRGEVEPTPQPDPFFGGEPAVEFKIGRIALGYDEAEAQFVLLIHSIDDEEGGTPNFRCLVTKDQLETIARQIDLLARTGRPRCPLCGTPLEPGVAHFCPPTNGHAPTTDE